MNYKDKLKLAKEALESGSYDEKTIKYIFPELIESEDEKIRRDLLHFLNAYIGCSIAPTFCTQDIIKWIAYLEKQGEHAKFRDSIQIGDQVTRNEDGVLVNLSQLNRVAKKDEKQGEQKPTIEMKTPEESLGIDSDTYNKIVDECIYGEQKPAWSEEDEKIRSSIINFIRYELNHKAYIGTAGVDSARQIEWLESLKDRVIPQSHWKPSDEQMQQLNIVSTGKGYFDKRPLKEMYEQLKKLKE